MNLLPLAKMPSVSYAWLNLQSAFAILSRLAVLDLGINLPSLALPLSVKGKNMISLGDCKRMITATKKISPKLGAKSRNM